MAEKAKVLLIGSGGVGTMCAYALESGGKAEVTAVLRSNYDAVTKNGFDIDSIEHGSDITGFRPTRSKRLPTVCRRRFILTNPIVPVTKAVPNATDAGEKYDFIVLTTKNIPDIKPTVADIVGPAVTPGHSAILLLQNGLNIEKPLIERFPTNTILSGVSLIGATEWAPGKVRHDDKDRLKVGEFESTKVSKDISAAAAKRFVELYSACGKVNCQYDEEVAYTRWRKLVYNSTYNSIATILRMDTCRMRIYEHVIDDLVRPAMLEIKAIASAAGISLPDDIVDLMINVDPTDTFFKPSMQQDIEKGNYIEFENIVGEAIREAKRLGVSAPTLTLIYAILKGLQTKVMEEKGLVEPVFLKSSRYV
jgi:2-dehydropantoate 2-reductase